MDGFSRIRVILYLIFIS